jgi:dipeptidyl-peptidase-4
MKNFHKYILLSILLIQPLIAQTEDKTILTLDRIFKNREFRSQEFGPVEWFKDGKYYTTLESSKDSTGGMDIVRYETISGKREILVPASFLIPQGEKIPLSISEYNWSSDYSMLMIFTNSERVWRYNTRGDYYVLNLLTHKLIKLGGDAKPSSLMFAKFSPDCKKVAYVREHNIYTENLDSGKIIQLTFDGSITIINGTFDWVYEEELDLRDGFRWSPDSKKIAYWQLDASGVNNFYLINDTDSLYSKIIPVQYPKAGTTNSSSRVGVISSEGGKTVWMKVQGDPRNNYIARMDWAKNSDEIVLQHLNRLQNKNEVTLGSALTGDIKILLTDTDSAWVDIKDDLKWLNDGNEFTWVSEKEGWRHIYLISRDGETVKLLTPGKYDIIEIQNIDEKDGLIYFTASPDNAAQKYLYSVPLDGSGKLVEVTPGNQKGTHSYKISDDGKFAIHIYSSFGVPNTVDMVELPEHKTIRSLIENKSLIEKVNSLQKGKSEFFKIDIGNGVNLDGWMMKPPDFDPSKKYPVLFYVYGEPAAQTVLDRWDRTDYLWHLMLTQQGYIVASIDNRGAPSPRGRAWRKMIYQKIGTLATQDQTAAVEALEAKYNYIDKDRIGVWGWSGGGSMTLNLLFRSPNIYKTGMAVAPVSNERFYDTIYEERYMGLPDKDSSIYESCSAATYAEGLKGNLLIVHGTGDDNVHFQNTEFVVNQLIKYNKPFTMMAYPNRTHGIYEGSGTTLHLFSLLTRYLYQNLPSGGK